MKMEHTECSETPAHIIRTPGNHPKERIKYVFHMKHVCYEAKKESWTRLGKRGGLVLGVRSDNSEHDNGKF